MTDDLEKAPAACAAGPGSDLSQKLDLIRQDVLRFRQKEILEHVEDMLREGASPDDIIGKGLIAAMDVINQQFKDGTVFIPEVLLSARTVNLAVEYLEPHLAREGAEAKGKILIGTVKGDMHDIGKNMVSGMLRGVGFKVVDLGINVPAEQFVEAVKGEKPQVLALSALLTTTLPEMENVLKALQESGVRKKVKVMIGGAPVTRQFADEIGADGYGADGTEAVDLARDFVDGVMQ